jgi:hypothetical protein
MTTSNTYSIQYSRDDLVNAAHYKLGVIADGQTLSPTQLTRGIIALNMSAALLRAKGMPLWERNSYTFSSINNVNSYNIGTGQTFNTPYPLKLLQCYRTDTGTRIDMDVEADYNFNQLPINSTGIPIKITYQPKVNYGILRLWPTPDTTAATSTFTIVYQQPFQYFVNSTDTADFPEEWYLPLVYRTATVLAPEYGIPLGDRNILMAEADKYTEEALSMGGEDASMFIQPYMQPGWGENRRG